MMNEDLQLITDMLSYRRPMESVTERAFIERFLLPIGVDEDPHGNLYKLVGPSNPTVLWSSHTDSVHYNEGQQKLLFDGKYIRLHPESKSNCLGADDAAGIFVMLGMIKAGVPGLYVFHFGEENGCLGSYDIKTKSPHFLEGIQAAIAFDRRGTTDIVTHMSAGRTCSDAFAASLAAQLEGYKPHSGGIVTDTAQYRKIVAECTNISVGYYDEHRSSERLDFAHLVWLRDRMVAIDLSKLVIERDPTADDDFHHSSFTWDSSKGKFVPATKSARQATIVDICWDKPNDVAGMLAHWGFTAETLKEAIHEYKQAREEKLRAMIATSAERSTKVQGPTTGETRKSNRKKRRKRKDEVLSRPPPTHDGEDPFVEPVEDPIKDAA